MRLSDGPVDGVEVVSRRRHRPDVKFKVNFNTESLASVSIRLSSITLFMDSIQFASKSPSSMIHFGNSSGIAPIFLITVESKPSFHSLVAMLM